MEASCAIEDHPIFHSQSGGGEQVVQVVAVFRVLVFRDEQEPSSRPDEIEDGLRLRRGKCGRAAGHSPFPARIARVDEGEDAGARERGAVQRTFAMAGHDEVSVCQGIGGILIRGIDRVFRLHFASALRGDRPAFTMGLVEENARHLALRGIHRRPPRAM